VWLDRGEKKSLFVCLFRLASSLGTSGRCECERKSVTSWADDLASTFAIQLDRLIKRFSTVDLIRSHCHANSRLALVSAQSWRHFGYDPSETFDQFGAIEFECNGRQEKRTKQVPQQCQ
jgi:hypothetical protein